MNSTLQKYQESKHLLSNLKPQVEHEQHLHEKTKKAVLEEFNLWFESDAAHKVISEKSDVASRSDYVDSITDGRRSETFVVGKVSESPSKSTSLSNGFQNNTKPSVYNPKEYQY